MPWPMRTRLGQSRSLRGKGESYETHAGQEEFCGVEASENLSGMENVEERDSGLRERLRLQGLADRPDQVTAVQRA